MAFKGLLLLAFAFVSTKGEPLFDPCFKDDIKCLSTATETFLSKTYGGFSNLSIKAIDPLVIPSLEVDVDDNMGLTFHFKDTSVTGLKNLKISDFKMDTTKKSVLLKMKANLDITSEITIGLTKSSRVLNGPYSATTIVHESSTYGYNIKNINGVDYFEVGQETNTCEIVDEPKVTLGPELQQLVDKDQDAVSLKPEWETKKVALRKKTLCKIANKAFETVIHNLRASAAAFPKSFFFKDI